MTQDLHPIQLPIHPDPAITFKVMVNSRDILLYQESATGLEIKLAAIKQHVSIEATFVLQLEQPNGVSKLIGDGDRVTLYQHISFTAIRPDDNS